MPAVIVASNTHTLPYTYTRTHTHTHILTQAIEQADAHAVPAVIVASFTWSLGTIGFGNGT